MPDESYSPGQPDAGDPKIVWSAPKDGLRVGSTPVFSRGKWHHGEELEIELWVSCIGDKAVKFSSTNRVDAGVALVMNDANGLKHDAEIMRVSTPLFPARHRLEPGQRWKVKTVRINVRTPRKER